MTHAAKYITRKRRFSFVGMVYIFVTILLAVGAINGENNLLHWAFGFSLGLLVVSGIVSGAMLMSVRVERMDVPDTHAGDGVGIRYRVTNISRLLPVFGLTITEMIEETDGAVRGSVSSPVAHAPAVPRRKSLIVRSHTIAMRRGPVRLRRFRVSSTFPIGLFRKMVIYEQPGRFTVLPAVLELRSDVLAPVRALGATNQSAPVAPGIGGDFFALRQYAPGDPMRQIAWRASARRDDTIVRQTGPENAARIWLVLDLDTESAPDEDRRERVIALASSLAGALTREPVDLGLGVSGGGAVSQPKPASGQAASIIESLATLDNAKADTLVPMRTTDADHMIVLRERASADPGGAPAALTFSGEDLERLVAEERPA